MTDRLTPPRILTDLRDRLERVIADDAFTCTTAEARSWLARIEKNIANPALWEDAHVVFGKNMHLPAIEGVFRDAEFHGRMPPLRAVTALSSFGSRPSSGSRRSALQSHFAREKRHG